MGDLVEELPCRPMARPASVGSSPQTPRPFRRPGAAKGTRPRPLHQPGRSRISRQVETPVPRLRIAIDALWQHKLLRGTGRHRYGACVAATHYGDAQLGAARRETVAMRDDHGQARGIRRRYGGGEAIDQDGVGGAVALPLLLIVDLPRFGGRLTVVLSSPLATPGRGEAAAAPKAWRAVEERRGADITPPLPARAPRSRPATRSRGSSAAAAGCTSPR